MSNSTIRIFNFITFVFRLVMLATVLLSLTTAFSMILSPVFLGEIALYLAIGAMWHFNITSWVLSTAPRWSANIVSVAYNLFHRDDKISPARFNMPGDGSFHNVFTRVFVL